MFFDINLDDYNEEEDGKNLESDDINESIEDNIDNDLCQNNSSDNEIKKDENLDNINELEFNEFYQSHIINIKKSISKNIKINN